MNGTALRERTGRQWGTGPQEAVLGELTTALFASLPRSDQRRRGETYLRGLLGARGRKSIRNIAALAEGPAAEQSLHHFVSSSTWDWGPVRRALAHQLARTRPPQAWVVRPMLIPKAGENSVGVERRFCPEAGQVVNAQQAVGVWAATAEHAVPVSWRLHLGESWLDDPVRRRQAMIPDTVPAETLGECVVESHLATVRRWGLPLRPVVLDARQADTLAALHRLRAAGVPVLARVGGSLRLAASDTPAGRTGEISAHQVLAAARDLRRPVLWRGPGGTVRALLTAAVRVALPLPGPAVRGRDMLLLAVGEHGGRWPAELWLTDLLNVPPAALVRLSRLVATVDRDFAELSDRVGMRDFTGRSFGGWHRHVTLASAAHAVLALGRQEECPAELVPAC
ncbi:IS701 family transposase [Streptomyces orinoci]|uniref:Transposase n=1 Tax=Streptomyces orinoci TaxID=67339 RepID=A0ABV3K439_STRON|nr:transposase [Streptomyces orinoci]